MMLFAKKGETSGQKALTFDRQFIFIEAPINIVGPEAVLWGDAAWWPKNSLIRVKKIHQQDSGLGAAYEICLNILIPQKYSAEVTQYEPGRLVVRTFKKGFFKGFESVRAEERANGTRVEYELHYAIPDPIRKILWNFLFRRIYKVSINKLLLSLHDYCLKQMGHHD